MILVDSSVWIDFFNQAPTPQRLQLVRWLEAGDVSIGTADLVVFEVLRGFRHERDLRSARLLMESLSIEGAVSADLAVAASGHYRHLRSRGHTVRSAVDALVASFCIERDYALLHDDRDFDAYEQHHGLRVWRH